MGMELTSTPTRTEATVKEHAIVQYARELGYEVTTEFRESDYEAGSGCLFATVKWDRGNWLLDEQYDICIFVREGRRPKFHSMYNRRPLAKDKEYKSLKWARISLYTCSPQYRAADEALLAHIAEVGECAHGFAADECRGSQHYYDEAK